MAIVIPPAVTSQKPKRYYLTQGYHAAHLALDMVGERGQPVLAAESGRVFASSWDGGGWGIGGGNCILIDHFGPDGRRAKTSYAHLLSRSVERYQYVLRGQVIGYADSTGNSSGNHLHFALGIAVGDPGLYYSYRWMDPRRYMRAHQYENGGQADGREIASLHVRNSVIVKPGSNIRRSPSLSAGILRTSTSRELTAYLGTVQGSVVWGVNRWDKLWHPRAGVGYLHTNLGEWVI